MHERRAHLCIQGERIATLETVLISPNGFLERQKQTNDDLNTKFDELRLSIDNLRVSFEQRIGDLASSVFKILLASIVCPVVVGFVIIAVKYIFYVLQHSH
jgi:hypothetical protein